MLCQKECGWNRNQSCDEWMMMSMEWSCRARGKMPIAELIGPTKSTSGVGVLPKVVMIGEDVGRESGWMDLGGFRARLGAIVGVYLLPCNELSS